MTSKSALIAALALLAPSAAFAGAKASSFQKETKRGSNYWNAQSATDGDLETAWRVPGDSDNTGEWIQIGIPKAKVEGVRMVIGWAKDEESFSDYGRVKAARVDVMQWNAAFELELVGSANITFEDKNGWQTATFPPIDISKNEYGGGEVKITITEIFPGVDYPSMGVSEVLVQLGDYDVGPVITEVSSEDKPREGLVDDNPRSFWVGDSEGASITFTAAGNALSKVGFLRQGTTYDRPKKIKISANGKEAIRELKDSKEMVWAELPVSMGYTGGSWGDIKVEVLEVYPGTSNKGKLALSELDAKAVAFDQLEY